LDRHAHKHNTPGTDELAGLGGLCCTALRICSAALLPILIVCTLLYSLHDTLAAPLYCTLLVSPWALLVATAYARPLFRRPLQILRRRHLFKRRDGLSIFALAASNRSPAALPKFPIIEDSGANRNMSPDKGLFVGPLIPLAQEVRTAEGVSTGVTASGTIRLDGQLLPCLYVPSFKQTMLAKSYFIRSGYTCNTTYKHPDTHVRFDFQLSDDDDLFHYVSSKLTCLNSLNYD
jgi:hypothetical protein